jgi:hypothetical protein
MKGITGTQGAQTIPNDILDIGGKWILFVHSKG